MAERKNFTVGAIVELDEGTVVTRPDGTQNTVTGGAYVLDVAGDYTLGDRAVTARAEG